MILALGEGDFKMNIYSSEQLILKNYLEHHGIKGQKWGVRRYQNKDGSLTKEGYARFAKKRLNNKRTSISNIDKWGKDKDHNALFITGLSGSGKSTIAKFLSDSNGAEIIHLDHYYDNPLKSEVPTNKEFDEYLNKNVPDYYNKIAKNYRDYVSNMNPNGDIAKKKEFWNTMDSVRDAMLDYSKDRYDKNKVIIEGVQILDTAMFPDDIQKQKALKGQPIIAVGTSPLSSSLRGMQRDGVPLTKLPEHYKHSVEWNKTYDEFKRNNLPNVSKEYIHKMNQYVNNNLS